MMLGSKESTAALSDHIKYSYTSSTEHTDFPSFPLEYGGKTYFLPSRSSQMGEGRKDANGCTFYFRHGNFHRKSSFPSPNDQVFFFE